MSGQRSFANDFTVFSTYRKPTLIRRPWYQSAYYSISLGLILKLAKTVLAVHNSNHHNKMSMLKNWP